MRVLIATDAWHPQVNGVVRTLTSLARSASNLDAEISFLTPDGFPSVGVPTYPGLRIALPNRREIARWTDASSLGRRVRHITGYADGLAHKRPRTRPD